MDKKARARRHAPLPGLAVLVLSALLLSGCLWDSTSEYRLLPPMAWQAPPEPAEAEAEAPDPALVQQAQQHLAVLGHQPGPRDGVLGPQTLSAIESYQAAKGLKVDSRLSASLVAALEADHAALEAEGALAAAHTAPDESQAATRVSPEPRYLPGSRYLYSNGAVHEVLATEGSEVRWRSNRGETFTNHRNFIVPSLAWSAGGIAGQRVLDVAPDALWQQATVSDAVFVATTTTRYGGGPKSLNEQRERWRCRLEGAASVTVLAGTFETEKLVCERLAADGSLELERTWYYAPSLRHFVLRQDLAGSAPAEAPMELVGIQPSDQDWPPAARGGLARAMQHVLEKLPSGEELDWSSSAIAADITIKAGDAVDWAGEERCRRLEQTWTTDGETWHYPRLACRSPDGEWRFPDPEGQQHLDIGLPS